MWWTCDAFEGSVLSWLTMECARAFLFFFNFVYLVSTPRNSLKQLSIIKTFMFVHRSWDYLDVLFQIESIRRNIKGSNFCDMIFQCSYFFWIGSNFRIPRNSFTCHWIRIASIVLCLDLQSLPTHVSEAEMSCGVFWSLALDWLTDDWLVKKFL